MKKCFLSLVALASVLAVNAQDNKPCKATMVLERDGKTTTTSKDINETELDGPIDIKKVFGVEKQKGDKVTMTIDCNVVSHGNLKIDLNEKDIEKEIAKFESMGGNVNVNINADGDNQVITMTRSDEKDGKRTSEKKVMIVKGDGKIHKTTTKSDNKGMKVITIDGDDVKEIDWEDKNTQEVEKEVEKLMEKFSKGDKSGKHRSFVFIMADDLDGQKVKELKTKGISNLVVDKAELTSLEMGISPNPSEGTFELSMNLGESGDADVKVYDMTGKIVYKELIKGASGKITRNVNLGADHGTGTFILQVIQNGKAKTQQMIVK